MTQNSKLLANGNLATARRTISGLLGQIAMFRCTQTDAIGIIQAAGLPASAYDDPDFPVSLEQDLEICSALVASMPTNQSPISLVFSVRQWLGLDTAGVLGMAMRTATNHQQAIELYLKYPQLSWGHCRLHVRECQDHVSYEFTIDRPQLRTTPEYDIERLVQYCLTLDLACVAQLSLEMSDGIYGPTDIKLPFPRPDDWDPEYEFCQIQFDSDEAALRFPREIIEATAPRANPLLFKNHSRLAEKLSKQLEDESSTAEKVSRWLWAHNPPLSRNEVAKLLAMSDRNLTRRLKAEKTSFTEILGEVQDQRGKNLLRNPSFTIAEVAYRIGYTDPATFTRSFSRKNGMSPQKWRQSQP